MTAELAEPSPISLNLSDSQNPADVLYPYTDKSAP